MTVTFVGVLAALTLPASGRANGDPASDVLLTSDVYLPYPPPGKETTAALRRAVADVYARHNRIKVAVIASPTDLGSVPTLFNKPAMYARFLGIELDSIFVGPLLIVMPSGFGMYDGGRSTLAEERILSGLEIGQASAEALTAAATTAVKRLNAGNALRSKDIRPPSVYAEVATGQLGEKARLKYRVVEDSERSSEVVRIFAGNRLRALIKTPVRSARAQRPHVVEWRLPQRQPPAQLRYCVTAIDPAGNAGPQACAQIFIIRPR